MGDVQFFSASRNVGGEMIGRGFGLKGRISNEAQGQMESQIGLPLDSAISPERRKALWLNVVAVVAKLRSHCNWGGGMLLQPSGTQSGHVPGSTGIFNPKSEIRNVLGAQGLAEKCADGCHH